MTAIRKKSFVAALCNGLQPYFQLEFDPLKGDDFKEFWESITDEVEEEYIAYVLEEFIESPEFAVWEKRLKDIGSFLSKKENVHQVVWAGDRQDVEADNITSIFYFVDVPEPWKSIIINDPCYRLVVECSELEESMWYNKFDKDDIGIAKGSSKKDIAAAWTALMEHREACIGTDNLDKLLTFKANKVSVARLTEYLNYLRGQLE